MSSTALEAALEYAARYGWAVYPVNGKVPFKGTRGYKDAAKDQSKIRELWAEFPSGNVSVATGDLSGVIVLDIDGPEGVVSLATLTDEHGELPKTPCSRTPRGFHWYFRHPGFPVTNSASKIAPGIDIKGDRGAAVAPPSTDRKWIAAPSEVEVAEAPAWLVEKIRPVTRREAEVDPYARVARRAAKASAGSGDDAYAEAALADEIAQLVATPAGQRNAQLNNAALALGGLVAAGRLDRKRVEAELRDAARQIGLDEHEIGPTIASGFAAGEGEPRYEDAPRVQVTGALTPPAASADKPDDESATPEPAPIRAEPITGLKPEAIPPRPWIFGHRYIRRAVTATIAPAGASKTTLGMHQAIAIASGTDWAGLTVHQRTPVWIFNNEEDKHELERRLFAALDHMSVPYAAVEKRIYLNSGVEGRPLVVAAKDRKGTVVALPDVDGCIAEIKRLGIGVFIVDPFVSTHTVSENDNAEVDAAAGLVRVIARRGECAVDLVHHTRKPAAGSSESHAGNADTARGASALIAVARVVHTLFTASAADAQRFKIADNERLRYVRLDGAKANYNLLDETIWFRRESVTLPNGDEVGVLTPVDMSALEDAAALAKQERHRTIIARLLTLVDDTMTLNKAGLALIDQRETLFPNYRDRDFGGKCPVTIRREIEAAVAANVTVNGESFVVVANEDPTNPAGGANRQAKVLRRHVVDIANEEYNP